MQSIKVEELMVPLAEYATVQQDATLFEAVMALEKAQEEFDHTRYKHRAILVLDRQGTVVGKLGQLDVLRALEPKYEELLESPGMSRFGFTRQFMKSMLVHYHLWDQPLADICRKASEQKVSKFMHAPTEGEYVEQSATLDEAIHQLVLGHHQSLLVTRDKAIVGVLRLTDAFTAVFHAMKNCQLG